MWKMLHESNAIECMAFSIRFAEPTSNMLAKRMQRALDDVARNVGLDERAPLQGFQVNINNPSEVRPIAGVAMLYQKTSLVRNYDGTVEKRVVSQIELQTTHLTYRTWKYGSWADELKAILEMLEPALQIASQGTTFGNFRLEYLDRFYFDGEASDASASDILSDASGWIAPHVFSSNALWHSHSGRFDREVENGRDLMIVNADYQDLTGPDPRLIGRRSVLLLTAIERQFLESGREVAGNELNSFLSLCLKELHSSVIALFRQVLNPTFADENRLSK